MQSSQPSCASLITPFDAVPGRAPLSLLSRVAARIGQRSVVVIGDGSTDGVNCFAANGATATAALVDSYAIDCEHLRGRANESQQRFRVHCGGLLDGDSIPDADVYVWSQDAWKTSQWRSWLRRGTSYATCRRYFGNCATTRASSTANMSRTAMLNTIDSFDLLSALRSLQLRGKVRATAEFAVILDERAEGDLWTLHRLHETRWPAWNTSVCTSSNETRRCTSNVHLTKSKSARHVCSTHETARWWAVGGSLRAVRAQPAAEAHCALRGPSGSGFNVSAETANLRRPVPRVTSYAGLTAAILPSGELLCAEAADRALDTHVARHPATVGTSRRRAGGRDAVGRAQTTPAAATAHGSEDGDMSSAPGGLLMMHCYRQAASEFAASAHVLGMSAQHWMVQRASLLLISTNPNVQTSSLLRWLRWYAWFEQASPPPPLPLHGGGGAIAGLRMLLYTKMNLGYMCGELHSFAATSGVWKKFPWVMTISGPDVLPLPAEISLLGRLISRAHASTALLYDRFRTSPNDPRSFVEERYNMDLTIFFPPLWLLPADNDDDGDDEGRDVVDERPRARWANEDAAVRAAPPIHPTFPSTSPSPYPSTSSPSPSRSPSRKPSSRRVHEASSDTRAPHWAPHSLWGMAAAYCHTWVRGKAERPEAILYVLVQRHNLSVRLIGNGSRGSLIDIHKSTFKTPDAHVWHAHNAPAVLGWLQSMGAPPNPYNRASHLDAVRAHSRCIKGVPEADLVPIADGTPSPLVHQYDRLVRGEHGFASVTPEAEAIGLRFRAIDRALGRGPMTPIDARGSGQAAGQMTQIAATNSGLAQSSGAGQSARKSVGQSLYTRYAQYYAAIERRVTLAINADGQKSNTG